MPILGFLIWIPPLFLFSYFCHNALFWRNNFHVKRGAEFLKLEPTDTNIFTLLFPPPFYWLIFHIWDGTIERRGAHITREIQGTGQSITAGWLVHAQLLGMKYIYIYIAQVFMIMKRIKKNILTFFFSETKPITIL
ncbi:hypothetical protein F4775DRAFT_163115 [Biscogniauxia sp. FL1348]|nr:hypothetical protein F4775DRAFT_163115 [Biscogniauxia sp. FL1348]